MGDTSHEAHAIGLIARLVKKPTDTAPGLTVNVIVGRVEELVSERKDRDRLKARFAELEAALRTTVAWCPECNGRRGHKGLGPNEASWVPCSNCGPARAVLGASVSGESDGDA